MLNHVPTASDEQTAAAAAEVFAVAVASAPADPFTPGVDVQAGGGSTAVAKCASSLPGRFLRLVGGTAGFLVGGPAGAAFGAAMGELAGDMAAERASMMLGRAFPHPKKEIAMKKMYAAVAAMTIMPGVGAGAAELPSYELMGFPISAHQFSLTGSARVTERLLPPTLTLHGMPGSPHQIAVLTPHRTLAGMALPRVTKAAFPAP